MSKVKSVTSKIKEVGNHGLVYGFGTALESLLQILLIPLFLNKFSTVEYGAFALIQLTASMSAAFFYFGGSTALNRFYFDAKTEKEKKICFSNVLFLTVFGSLLMILLFSISGKFIVNYLFQELLFLNTFYFLFCSFALTIVNTIFFILIRLLKKSLSFVALKLISLISSVCSIFILINMMNNVVDATALGFLVGQVIVLLIMLIKYKSSIVFILDINSITKFLKFGIPMAFSGLLFIAIDWIIRFFVKNDLGLDNLGLYSMGLKLGSLIQAGFIIPFAMIWSTVRMEYRKDKNTFEFFDKITTYYFLIGIFIILIISINIDQIIFLISEKNTYQKSLILIPIILFSQLIFGSVNILDFGMFINNKTIYYTLFHFITLIIVSTISFLLMNEIGIIGAAFVHLLSNYMIASMVYIKSNKYFKMNINYRTLLPCFFSSVLLFLFFNHFIEEQNIWMTFQKNFFIIISFIIIVYIFLPINEKIKINLLLKNQFKKSNK